jgi:hypothetical protein
MESLLLLVAGNLLSVLGQPFAYSHIQDSGHAYLANTGNTFEVGLQTGRKAPAVNFRSHALQCSACSGFRQDVVEAAMRRASGLSKKQEKGQG